MAGSDTALGADTVHGKNGPVCPIFAQLFLCVTAGGDTQEQLSKYRADWAILSVDGVSAQGGITTCHPEEAIIDRLMMANARNRLIAATGNKIGKAGFSRICDGDASIQLITDNTCDKDALLALQERGVKVVKV